jgi:hypothetical protein
LLQEAKAIEWKPQSPQGQPADAAQNSFPKYVVPEHGGALERLRAANVNEYPDKNPGADAREFRHRYRDSMAVLGGMLALLTALVIIILRRRDTDPQ